MCSGVFCVVVRVAIQRTLWMLFFVDNIFVSCVKCTRQRAVVTGTHHSFRHLLKTEMIRCRDDQNHSLVRTSSSATSKYSYIHQLTHYQIPCISIVTSFCSVCFPFLDRYSRFTTGIVCSLHRPVLNQTYRRKIRIFDSCLGRSLTREQ